MTKGIIDEWAKDFNYDKEGVENLKDRIREAIDNCNKYGYDRQDFKEEITMKLLGDKEERK